MWRRARLQGMVVQCGGIRIFHKDSTSFQNSWVAGKPRLEENLNYVLRIYEEFIGLKDVKLAQNRVIEAETKFKEAQEERIRLQQRMLDLQTQLREIHTELDKTVRGEDRYLQLVTKEHSILKEDKHLLNLFKSTEKQEHDYFSLLSFALRESHEKERAQAEKTKYWSIIGSVTGTVIGVIGTTITNHYRMKQLKALILDASSGTSECHELMLEIRDGLNEQKPAVNMDKLQNHAGLADSGKLEELVERTTQLEASLTQYSIVAAGVLTAYIVIIPLISWLIPK